jgi:hypothetical protein
MIPTPSCHSSSPAPEPDLRVAHNKKNLPFMAGLVGKTLRIKFVGWLLFQ